MDFQPHGATRKAFTASTYHRIKPHVKEIKEEVTLGNLTFTFKMTNHFKNFENPENCTRVAVWINNWQDPKKWINLNDDSLTPHWIRNKIGGNKPSDYRIALIQPAHPLYELIHRQDQRLGRPQWLIFKGHPAKDSVIKVCHFGPFGDKKHKDNLRKVSEFKAEFEHEIRFRRIQASEKYPDNEFEIDRETLQSSGADLLSCNYLAVGPARDYSTVLRVFSRSKQSVLEQDYKHLWSHIHQQIEDNYFRGECVNIRVEWTSYSRLKKCAFVKCLRVKSARDIRISSPTLLTLNFPHFFRVSLYQF